MTEFEDDFTYAEAVALVATYGKKVRRETAREIADYADRIVEQGAVLTGRLIRMKWLEDGDG